MKDYKKLKSTSNAIKREIKNAPKTIAKNCGIVGFDDIIAELRNIEKNAQTVCDRTVSDVVNRGPSWIAQGVADRYGIKKADIVGQKIGKVNTKSTAVGLGGTHKYSAQLVYTGRQLTPVHFGMRPIKPPSVRSAYTLKATIYKGNRETIGKVKKLTKKQLTNVGRNFTHQGTQNSPQSPWMLQPTGNRKRGGGVDYIPFQRRSQTGGFQHAMRTVSLPQMITEGKDGPMHPEVEKRFIEALEKRLANHSKLLEK